MLNEYKIIKSHRKSIAIEVSREGEITVRAPLFCSRRRINTFLNQKQAWIEKTVRKMKMNAVQSEPISKDEIEKLREKAKELIPQRVEQIAALMSVGYNGVKITSATKRFGSCSAKNSLCFSLYLMQFEWELIDYVIVHELAHTVHHNHSASFYKLVEKYLPDYKARQRALKARRYPINHKPTEVT